ncbi:hypothetical protein A2U01_0001596 [Trifolium medium]|uniref:Retrotransposon gag domain-containing protein n=1 Tax=Trifolium medium TaxID=97028 RepID=A0A392M0I6_9FABA|nr:hypothetical protein [Trifolium medium]
MTMTETTEMEDDNGTHQNNAPTTTEIARTTPLETYDGTKDPDEHLEHIDTILDYYQAPGAIKCRLFVLTLKGPTMTWFKGLEDDSIDSWRELCRVFSSHFKARKRQPKTMASLSNIIQGKEESLRDYIERFTKEAIEVKGAHDTLKCYIFEKGLRSDTKFKEKLGLKELKDMQDILSRAQNYINYEEKMLREKPEKVKNPPRKDERAREERGRRTPKGGYHEYTLLNATREKILQDCINTEFADAGIQPPKELRENPRTDKSKFCRYHRSTGHETEDCIQLNDTIENLVRRGKLSRYTLERNREDHKRGKRDSPNKHARVNESPKRKCSPERRPPPEERVEVINSKEDDDSEEEKYPGKRPFVATVIGGPYGFKGRTKGTENAQRHVEAQLLPHEESHRLRGA